MINPGHFSQYADTESPQPDVGRGSPHHATPQVSSRVSRSGSAQTDPLASRRASTRSSAQPSTPASSHAPTPPPSQNISTQSRTRTPASGHTIEQSDPSNRAAPPRPSGPAARNQGGIQQQAQAPAVERQQAQAPAVERQQGQRVRRAAAVQGELQRKKADAKSLNSPYQPLTPIVSQGESDFEMDLGDDTSGVPVTVPSEMKDPILVSVVSLPITLY